MRFGISLIPLAVSLLTLFSTAYSLRCDSGQYTIHAIVNYTHQIATHQVRWTIQTVSRSGRSEISYRENLPSLSSNQTYSFEYCVPVAHLLLSFTSPMLSEKGGFMTLFVESVYLFSISLDSTIRRYHIPLEQSILFSDAPSFYFKSSERFSTQLLVLHSVLATCIQLGSTEVCFSERESLSISPELVSGDILVMNPNRSKLTIIPVLDVVQRTANLQISSHILERELRCELLISFNGRQEWINGLLLSPSHPYTKHNYYYIVGQLRGRDDWSFIDYQEEREERFLRLGSATKDSYETLLVITNSLDLCHSTFPFDLISYNPIKIHFGTFDFKKHEIIHIQLPCSFIYSYHIQSHSDTQKSTPLSYDINPMTGILSNRHGKIVSASLTVIGSYRPNVVLESISCVPKMATFSITIRYDPCTEPRTMYQLIWDLNESFWPHARFLINHSFFVEYIRGPTHFSRTYCTDSSILHLENLDHCQGTLSIYVEDALLKIVSFLTTDDVVEIQISNVASLSYKDLHSDAASVREYTLQPSSWVDGILDVFVKNTQVLSIVFNDYVLFTRNQSSLVDTISTLHLLSPIQSFSTGVLMIAFKPTPNLRVHSLIHHHIPLAKEYVTITVHDHTLFLSSRHGELLSINSILLPKCRVLPPVTVEIAIQGKWRTIEHRVLATGSAELNRDCLIQFPNRMITSQIRFVFSEVPSEESYGEWLYGAYWPLRLWSGREDLTPGLFFDVFEGCWTWIQFGENEPFSLTEPVLWVGKGLVLDWENEVLFGIAQQGDMPTFSPTDREPDSSVLLRHIRVRSCEGDRMKMEIRCSEHCQLAGLRISDGDEIWVVPEGVQLDSIVVCVHRHHIIHIESIDQFIQVQLDGFWYHFSVSSDTLFSTYFTILPSEVITTNSRDETAVHLNPYSFSLTIPLASMNLNHWIGQSLLVLSIKTGIPELMMITAIHTDEASMDHLSMRCEDQCQFFCRVNQMSHSLNLTLTSFSSLSPSHIIDSMRFSLLFLPTVTFYAPKLILSSHDAFVSPEMMEDSSLNTFGLVPNLQPLVWLQMNLPTNVLSCLNVIQIRFMVLPPQPLVIRILDGTSQVILHNTIAIPRPVGIWTTMNLQQSDVMLASALRITLEPLRVYKEGPLELRLQHVAMYCQLPEPARFVTDPVNEVEDLPQPLLARLEKLAKPKEGKVSEKEKISLHTGHCPEEWDEVEGVLWKQSPTVMHVMTRCKNGRRLTRFCDAFGHWSAVEGTCKSLEEKNQEPTLQELLHTEIRRVVVPSKPGVEPKPVSRRYCLSESWNGTWIPQTVVGNTIEVACASPAYGNITLECNSEGIWTQIAGGCEVCPEGSYPEVRGNEVSCVRCPPGTAFLRGNPRHRVKCYGQFYSKGGTTECAICDGETRGSRETGNIACKSCEGGVVIGLSCVNTTFCRSDDKRIPVGSLDYMPCDHDMKGYKTRMCSLGSGITGIWGLPNSDGCFPSQPPLGFSEIWIELYLKNVHSLVLRRKYNDNTSLSRSQTVLMLIETLKDCFPSALIRFIHYEDLSKSTQLLTGISFLFQFENTAGISTFQVSSILHQKLPELTLSLKEKNPYIFHHYFSLTRMEILYEAVNDAFCESSGIWPRTGVNQIAKSHCLQVDQLGYRSRRCEEQNGVAVWGEVDESHCNPSLQEMKARRILRVSFSVQKSFDSHETMDALIDKMNCDNLSQMTHFEYDDTIRENSSQSNFTHVFKHCKVQDNSLQVYFVSSVPFTRSWIAHFFSYARVDMIHVTQESLVARSSFELIFSSKPLEKCDSQKYLFCNQKNIVPSLFCHYRMSVVTQKDLPFLGDDVWLF